jgi:hypothetical protein
MYPPRRPTYAIRRHVLPVITYISGTRALPTEPREMGTLELSSLLLPIIEGLQTLRRLSKIISPGVGRLFQYLYGSGDQESKKSITQFAV